MRRRNAVDGNQQSLVDIFSDSYLVRAVIKMQLNKDGFPDLVVLIGPFVVLVEVKTLEGKLTPKQVTWHNSVKGGYAHIVRTEQDVYNLLASYESLIDSLGLNDGRTIAEMVKENDSSA